VITFLAHFLIVLVGWTLTIKFLFPLAFAVWQGVALGTYVYWDFWWVVHLWLALRLLHWRSYSFALAIGVSVAEIAIVVTKLTVFLAAPEWTLWTTNWFINKLFVLLCFSLMFPYLVANRRLLLGRPVKPAEGS
jgi:hypothetical protein